MWPKLEMTKNRPVVCFAMSTHLIYINRVVHFNYYSIHLRPAPKSIGSIPEMRNVQDPTSVTVENSVAIALVVITVAMTLLH